ncbi:MAG TPA: STAS/SEC14 domain-containing protein [Acidimicrobiales bacterium]
MITAIPDMPEGTIGFEASGKVADEDYESVLVPAVRTALEQGEVRLLYVLPEGTSYSAGAMFADAKLWAGHLRGWERVAIVSDAEWLENAIKAFGWMMPGEVRLFDDDEVDEARRWLVGGA